MSNKRKLKAKPQPTIMFKPGLYIFEVQHDDWCRYWVHRRPDDCNCNPNHVIRTVGDTAGQN